MVGGCSRGHGKFLGKYLRSTSLSINPKDAKKNICWRSPSPSFYQRQGIPLFEKEGLGEILG
jgi:hypothetical protein